MAIGDLNGDGYDDLAVGVPGEDVGSVVDAGAVHVMYGSSSGLSMAGNKAWYEDLMESQSEEGDACGSALASADFDGDGYDDLAVGIPRDDLIDIVNSGYALVAAAGATPESRVYLPVVQHNPRESLDDWRVEGAASLVARILLA